MTTVGAIAVQPLQSVGETTPRRPGAAQRVFAAWPRSVGHGVHDAHGIGMATHELLSAVMLRRAARAHVYRLMVLGETAASLAQEVRNPLGAMLFNAKAALNWLNAEEPNLEQARQAIADIVASGNDVGNLVTTIGSFVKTHADHRRPLDVNKAVLASITLSRGETRRHGACVKTDLAAGLPAVEGDSAELLQVLLNLIRNAAEAMGNMVDEPREILVVTEAVADGVRVAVQDRGPGFDPLDADRLFEAFYTTKPGAVGIGLALCQCIVEAHGRRIGAVANNPRGAVVQFVLPTGSA